MWQSFDSISVFFAALTPSWKVNWDYMDGSFWYATEDVGKAEPDQDISTQEMFFGRFVYRASIHICSKKWVDLSKHILKTLGVDDRCNSNDA